MPKNLDVEKPRDSGAIEELETAEAFLAEELVRNAAGDLPGAEGVYLLPGAEKRGPFS